MLPIVNFRDIAHADTRLIHQRVFRSATLTTYQNDTEFIHFLNENNIVQIIDLRADRELAADGYTNRSKSLFNYTHAPFDPWRAHSQEFDKQYNYGTNVEIAYRFFILECKASVAFVMRTILAQKSNAVLIHCHAGKDRTGIIVALLYLIMGINYTIILQDYLASKLDTKEAYLKIMLELIDLHGGIEFYLRSCGLTTDEIQQLKIFLLNK